MSNRDVAIEARGLSKQYRLGGGAPHAYGTLAGTLSSLGQRFRRKGSRPTIWALDDVSFSVDRGEAIGIIGPNGAGKSTLLKLLSRITVPTRGTARIRGRLGSLLEVGTGFHPELTGRENVYFNGAILGMRKREIDRKFDEIVAFSEVERFIDTPVKHYSTGMEVRLGFAVAAHLDAEILLVDEVLSVGDFGFQRRSLRKMEEQTHDEGRTVLFVSHNLAAVKTLTDRCIWLDGGRVRALGPTEDVFRAYVAQFREGGGGFVDLSDLRVRRPRLQLEHDVVFESLTLLDSSGQRTDTFLEGEPVTVVARLRAERPLTDAQVDLEGSFITIEGLNAFSANSVSAVDLAPGLHESTLTVDPNRLSAGNYSINVRVRSLHRNSPEKQQDAVFPAVSFRVQENPRSEEELRFAIQDRVGLFRCDYQWSPPTPVDAPALARTSPTTR